MIAKRNFAEFLLVAFPPPDHSSKIMVWKQTLKKLLKWINSCDSKAHVTLAEFWDINELAKYQPRLRAFCKTAIAEEVVFNKLIFGKETFLIDPDRFSKKYINSLIRKLHNQIGKKNYGISAHISIARRLSIDQMEITRSLFNHTDVNVYFKIDTLYLLKFDLLTGQYSEIVEKFEITGKSQPDLFTLSF